MTDEMVNAVQRAETAEREVALLKDIIEALVPDRHAVGELVLLVQGTPREMMLQTVVTVPVADGETIERALLAALKLQLEKFAELYDRGVARVIEAINAHDNAAARALDEIRAERARHEGAAMVAGLDVAIAALERAQQAVREGCAR